MKNNRDRILTGFPCFDEVSGGLPVGELTWIWGALPFVDENLWFGLSLSLEPASKYGTTVSIVCFQTDPRSLKDCIEIVFPGLHQKIEIASVDVPPHEDSKQSIVRLVDARITNDAGLTTSIPDLFAGIQSEIVVMESIATRTKLTGPFNFELFSLLGAQAQSQGSVIIIIPLEATYGLLQPVQETAKHEEVYSPEPCSQYWSFSVFIVQEGELQYPVAGYRWLGTVRLDVTKGVNESTRFVFMRYFRKETRQAELTDVDPWDSRRLRSIVKFECGHFEVVWKD